jgi:hypothetical protein
MNKFSGLFACEAIGAIMRPDALSIACDAHSKRFAATTSLEEIKKAYPPGAMQKQCDNEGACERNEIVDVIWIMRIDKDSTITAHTLPYSYHGKHAGTPFKWLDEHPQTVVDLTAEQGEIKFEGTFPDTLRNAMSGTGRAADHMTKMLAVSEMLGIDKAHRQEAEFRALKTALKACGFGVFDMSEGALTLAE